MRCLQLILLFGGLCLLNSNAQSVHCLVCELIFLIDDTGLFECSFNELSNYSKSGVSSSHNVILLIDLLDLCGSTCEGILNLLDSFRVYIISLLDLLKSFFERRLCIAKKLKLGIEGSKVVVDLDGSLGNSLNDFSNLLVSLGSVVSSSSSEGSKNGSSNSKS